MFFKAGWGLGGGRPTVFDAGVVVVVVVVVGAGAQKKIRSIKKIYFRAQKI